MHTPGGGAGCTHFIIGRDMAGCKSTITGEDFYGAYDAQNFAADNAPELGMQTVPSLNITYTEVCLPSSWLSYFGTLPLQSGQVRICDRFGCLFVSNRALVEGLL
jgi:ATP-sulfurylase